MSDLEVTPVSASYPLVITVCLSLFGTTLLTWCFASRVKTIESWRNLSYTRWLMLGVYVDSYCFVVSTSILQVGIGLTGNFNACEAVTFMCILFYCSSKVLIYVFLIERVHIVRGGTKTRKQDTLYWFNILGLIPYCAIVILAIIFRVNVIDGTQQCYVGLSRQSSFPLLIYDLVINIYLTSLFIFPMLGLYSYRIAQNPRIRQVAKRTLIGTLATLTSSIANISAVFALKGHEPAFICLACCTADVAFSAVVLHWVTSVAGEDGHDGSLPRTCLYHSRGTPHCCVSRARSDRRSRDSQTKRTVPQTTSVLFDDLKGLAGPQGPSTITTEITSGPRPGSNGVVEIPSPKARKVLGWFHRRTSVDEQQKQKKSLTDGEDLAVNERPGIPSRLSHSTDLPTTNAITVQYDIRRTVEDVNDHNEESTTGSCGDCITVIDEERRNDDMV